MELAEPMPPAAPKAPDRDRADTAFFGHPMAFGHIFATEICLSFAYYGLVSILTLYMSTYLFLPGTAEKVIGFGPFSRAMGVVFGAKSPLELASATFGLVTGIFYATPLIGGLIGDRWLGTRNCIVAGLVIQTFGYALLPMEAFFLLGMILMVIGGGLVKSNLLGQVGALYGPEDSRRTGAYGLFLIAVNIGGFITPLVVGTLGEKVGWSYGLAAAAVGMSLGLVAYLAGVKRFPARRAIEAAAPSAPGAARGPTQGLVVAALLLVLVGSMLNVGAYNQAFNIFPVWAREHVDRTIGGFEVPVTWFSTLDGILTIVATALAVRIWTWQSRGGRQPRETSRVMVGTALTACAFLVLALAAATSGGGKAHILLPILFFMLADAALPWVDTVIMSLYSRVGPAGLATTLLGVYYLSFTGGNLLVGRLGQAYEHMAPSAFWGLHAAMAGAGLIWLALLGGWMNRVFDASMRARSGEI
jgi:POT family proton-dependent oligopeptide transporter